MTTGEISQHAANELQCIAALVAETLRKGRQWLNSLKPDDWRSLRYRAGRPPHFPTGYGTFPQNKLGKPPVALVGSEHALKSLVIEGEDACVNILVQPDNRAAKENWIPILSIVAEKNNDKIRHVNFHLWFHGVAKANLGEDQIFGWRFEGSEGQNTSHDFFHAQPVRSFVRGNSTPGFVQWMPETFPAVPIAAKDNLQLAFAALVTLGGKEALRKIIQNATDGDLRHRAREYWGSIYADDPIKGKEVPTDKS